MFRSLPVSRYLSAVVALFTCSVACAQKVPTTTTLEITSSGSPVTSVVFNTPLTLTATVSATANTTRGEVRFCDTAINAACGGPAIIGTGQIRPNGSARIVVRLSYGAHAIKAIYAGINTLETSASGASAITVTGTPAGVTTSITATGGSGGKYTLDGKLTGIVAQRLSPAGPLQFVDTSYGDRTMGTAPLAISAETLIPVGLYTQPLPIVKATPPTGFGSMSPAVADFNNDGLPEVLFVCGGFTVQSPSSCDNNGAPSAAVAVDVNRDGNMDLVYTEFGGSILTKLALGNGDGTFQGATVIEADAGNGYIYPVAVGDFDGDGFLDFMGGYSAFWGNGDGTFQKESLTVSNGSGNAIFVYQHVAVADLNGDGCADVLADGKIYYGSATRTFTQSTGYDDYVLGDFNNDGKIDIVSNNVVHLGNGDGTFHAAPGSAANVGGRYGQLVGDFNGDGNLDIAAVGVLRTVNGTLDPVQIAVDIYFGDGAGVFQKRSSYLGPSTFAQGSSAYAFAAAADVNGDGLTDITGLGADLYISTEWTAEKTDASAPEAGDHEIKAFIPASGIFPDLTSSSSAVIQGAGSTSGPGNPGGTQTTSTTLSITSAGSPVATVAAGTKVTLTATVTSSVAGLNGSVRFCDLSLNASCLGSARIATAQVSSVGTATVSFVLPVGVHSVQAQYAGTTTYATSNSAATALTVSPATAVSLNLTSSGVAGNYTLKATVPGSGTTPTGDVEFRDTSNSNAVVATAAFDAGLPTIHYKTGTIELWNDPLQKDPDGVPHGSQATKGDFNGDGKIDYISSGAVVLGNGDGTFQPAVTISGLPPNNVIGDFDGDGNLDVAGASNSGSGNYNYPLSTLMVAYGRGDGTFETPVSVASTYDALDAAADINNDGFCDLLVRYTVYLGHSNRTFSKVTSNPALNGLSGGFAGLADMNGDGRLDIVRASTSSTTHPLWVHLGGGDGTFGDPIVATAPPFDVHYYDNVHIPLIADFDGDGKMDAMFVDAYYRTREEALSGFSLDSDQFFFPGNGDGTFGAPVKATAVNSVSPNNVTVSEEDADGDGLPDVLITGSNIPSIYFGVSRTYTATASAVAIAGSGNHLVDAFYAGDALHSSASSSYTVTLQGGGTVPTVALSVTPAAGTSYGSTLRLTVTLSGTGLAPSATNGESIQFFAGSTSIGSAPLTNGVAELSISNLDPGTYALTAHFAGDSALDASTSQARNVTITKAIPSIAWSQPAPIVYGTALSATQLNASAKSPQGAALTGTFTYTPAAGAVLDPGTQTLVAHFAPSDTTRYVEVDGSVNMTITKATPTVTLSGPSTAPANTAVTFTGTVQGSGSGPTGQVSLMEGTAVLTTGTLSNGTATLSYTFSASGPHSLTLQYAGDARYVSATSATSTITVQNLQPVITWSTPAPITYNAPLTSAQLNATAKTPGGQNLAGTFVYTPSAGNVLTPGTQTLSVVFTPSDNTYSVATKTVNLVVNKAPSSVSVTQTWPTTVGVGTSVNTTFTAAVSSTAGMPGGQVTFFDGTTQVGTVALVNGSAQLTTSFSGVGTHAITATYGGDATFLGSTSPVFNEVVVAPNLSIVANPASLTIHQGGTGTSTIKVTPIGNYTGKIDFSCSNLPSLTTCTFSPPTIVMNGDNAVQTTTLSVSTQGPNVGGLRSQRGSGLAFAALLGLPCAFIGFSRRRRAALQTWIAVSIIAILAGSAIGCGSPDNVTPKGTTSMQVVAQASASGGGSAQSQSVKIDITIVP